MKNKIFLGGTCSSSTWRDELIKELQVPYFNPIVKEWNFAAQEEEKNQKKFLCNIHLYVITREMEGVFSIAEIIDSVSTEGKITIFQLIPEGFSVHQIKSFKAVIDLVINKGGIAFIDNNINRLVNILNSCFVNNY